jgi:hypothetical protein
VTGAKGRDWWKTAMTAATEKTKINVGQNRESQPPPVPEATGFLSVSPGDLGEAGFSVWGHVSVLGSSQDCVA